MKKFVIAASIAAVILAVVAAVVASNMIASGSKLHSGTSDQFSGMTTSEIAQQDIVPVSPELTTDSLLSLVEEEAQSMKSLLELNYAIYRARNNDVSGILRVVGLGIDEPVVSVSDNLEYLRTNVDKESEFTGVLFFDERIQGSIKTVPNVVVYGHNVGNGSMDMFAPLLQMQDQEVFDNVSIMLYQGENLYVYKPFTAYVTNTSNLYNDPYPASLADVLEDRPVTPSADVELTDDSKIITLSTCTNNSGDERFVVQAVLVNVF